MQLCAYEFSKFQYISKRKPGETVQHPKIAYLSEMAIVFFFYLEKFYEGQLQLLLIHVECSCVYMGSLNSIILMGESQETPFKIPKLPDSKRLQLVFSKIAINFFTLQKGVQVSNAIVCIWVLETPVV